MDPSGNTIVLRIIIIVILLALSAYFSSAETALTMVNKIRMRTLADDGNQNPHCRNFKDQIYTHAILLCHFTP